MRWMRWTFVRNAVIAVKAVKINISPRFTAFLTKIHRKTHRISYKNSPHRLLYFCNKLMWEMRWKRWMRWKKKFTAFHHISYKNSPHMIPKVYSIWFKFTRYFKDVSDIWRCGLSRWRHAGGQSFKPAWGRFFFVRKLRTRWKWIIHRNSLHSPQKDVRNTRWKFFFSPHFTAFLTKIHRQTSTREGTKFLKTSRTNHKVT